ncbi:low-density lipoprotein receptor 1-like isoform X3 [Vespa mandarinia]|uniref:low-density lipoprotein receptor 1-like isoform X3 n=1 Tax=Vespa mandarinia TaxID=7446 RepID=UPI00160E264C|nr:low-density lipoprotein receptor 1-like isoform X3 [Vespa mandarinia]
MKNMKEEMNFWICTSAILIVFVILPSTSYSLTTFGKTNSQNQNQNPPPPPTPVGKARECRSESDCAGIQNTTCLADQRDGKTRCLCGDYNAPVNGACNNKYKAIRASCNDDNECIEGAHCTVKGNNTTSGKRCYCREGYVENNLMCNGCSSIFSLSWMIFLVTTLLLGRINYL